MKREIRLFSRLATLALLLLCVFGAKDAVAQTDYTGVYYIGSAGQNSSANNKYYLCPTEGWCFYAPVDDFTSDNNDKPFLTTYRCKSQSGYDLDKAVWTIEKAPAPNSAYYYIKQTSTGRYILSNGQIRTSTNADRMRVHLGMPDDPNVQDDQELETRGLFSITPYNGNLVISPQDPGIPSDHKWLVVNGGNVNYLVGRPNKTGGPTGYEYTTGIIGIYTQGDQNAPFYLEPAPPAIINNWDGTITILAANGADIYYTTDETTPTTTTYTGTGTSSVTFTLTETVQVIKAIAKATDFDATAVRTYNLPVCERPEITVSSGTVTITCATAGATIHYTTDNTPATSSSTSYNGSFPLGSAAVIRAIATKPGYYKSNEAIYYPTVVVHNSSEITNMEAHYILASDFVSTASIGTQGNPFQGGIDGNMVVLSGLTHALVANSNGATIKNVFLDNVNISSGTNVGAICNEATGASRIYNCGVLATGSPVTTDENGYTTITSSSCSSTISGSGSVGGIVGLLDGESRVINCFSYANITGGNLVGGIVGENTVATTANNLKTMVMNCMFYGDITGGSSKAPIYNGTLITNDGDYDGVNNYNYFRAEASYVQGQHIDVYNCALSAETRFLQRFEFFRHLLNSNRALAAWWVTGDIADKDEIMKWVMDPAQIGTSTPYPILKTPGKYPSVVNYTPSIVMIDANNEYRNEGRKLGTLAVTIQMSSQANAPSGAGLKPGQAATFNLTVNDKDPARFNFNYANVQLPYYNDYCTGNYTGNRVVTGWKIVTINPSGTGTYSTPSNPDVPADAPDYNFADRSCTGKDLYSVSGRIFNQGAYWDVPEGVTAITIEPYWAQCVYLSDGYLDVVYKNDSWTYASHTYDDAMRIASDVTSIGGGQHYTNGQFYNINGDDQKVYTTLGNATSALNPSSGTVYDNAIVLVGNYHHTPLTFNGSVGSASHKYTVTSIDLDFDNEPDANLIMRFNGRCKFHPVRYDFLNLTGLGMAQKTHGGTGTYNFGIMQPLGWFEVTNTGLFRCTQFEYSPADRVKKPIILQGGVVEQWVTQQQDAGDLVEYFHVGGNVWFKEFHRGSHQDNTGKKTPHPPISVTGGDFKEFYLTGLYQPQATIYDDNAECYINGGRFGVMAGAGMEGIGTTTGKGNITWLIDNADINEFYGGGINASKPVFGNISTTITNSHVDSIFCGGPKFGDMQSGRTVTTEATNCKFKTYFGAGYGGNSYSRRAPSNQNNVININWNNWVNGDVGYHQVYNAEYGGVETQINYQFIPYSGNVDNVARLWIEYVGFSLATTQEVTSELKGCTVTDNFYGGGSLGKVDVSVTSVLDSCMVKGNVFGAGYSATLPPVEVMDLGGFATEPYYLEQAGTFLKHKYPNTQTYTWEHRDVVNNTSTAINTSTKKLFTTEDLGTLGTVTGNVELTLKGKTHVEGDVFGGGAESKVVCTNNGKVTVTLQGKTHVEGNVYGGGDRGKVEGDTEVKIIEANSGD